MAMAIDSQQQRQFGGGMPFDHMPYSHPHFTNPWVPSSGAPSSHQLYTSSNGLNPSLGLDTLAKQQVSRMNNNVSMPPYASVPMTTASAGSSLFGGTYGQEDLLTMSQDLLNPSRMQNASSGYGTDISYTSAPPPPQATYTSASPYDTMGYAPAPLRSTFNLPQHAQPDSSRRLSQT